MALAPHAFRRAVESQDDLIFVDLDDNGHKKKKEKLRLDLFVETAVLSFSGTRLLEPGPVFSWMTGPELEVHKKFAEDIGGANGELDDSNARKKYLETLEQRHKLTDRIMDFMFVLHGVYTESGGVITLRNPSPSDKTPEDFSKIIGTDVLTVETCNETWAKIRNKSGSVKHCIPATSVLVRFYASGYAAGCAEHWHVCRAAMHLCFPSKEIGGKSRLPKA